MALDIPVFIIMRDRVTCARRLVDWLEAAGVQRITLVDNDSRWEPLLEYYRQTPHKVVRLGKNIGMYSPWEAGLVPADEPYVVTDPDTIPTEDCPKDALGYFKELLERWERPKVGFGYRTDDVPDHYESKSTYVRWENQFSDPKREIAPGVFDAEIDTMFALYRRGQTTFDRRALRTGAPYLARHESCYLDSKNLSEEEAFYRSRCGQDMAPRSVGTWVKPEVASMYEHALNGGDFRWVQACEDVPARSWRTLGVLDFPEKGIVESIFVAGGAGIRDLGNVHLWVAEVEPGWVPIPRFIELTKAVKFAGPVAVYAKNVSDEPVQVDVRVRFMEGVEAPTAPDVTAAYYASKVWKRTTWFGTPVLKAPTDLWALQEVVFDVKPDLIVETGTFMGGSAAYLACLLDGLGAGEVVTIDTEERRPRPEHPRVTYVKGSSTDDWIVADVLETATDRCTLLVLDSDHTFDHVLRELRCYADAADYIVVEDTNTPGPAEAVAAFLAEDPRFEVDREREKFGTTFNKGGFLRRKA